MAVGLRVVRVCCVSRDADDAGGWVGGEAASVGWGVHDAAGAVEGWAAVVGFGGGEEAHFVLDWTFRSPGRMLVMVAPEVLRVFFWLLGY